MWSSYQLLAPDIFFNCVSLAYMFLRIGSMCLLVTDPRVADTYTEGRGMRIVSFKYVLLGDGDTGTQQHLLTGPYCTLGPGFFIADSRPPELIP